MNHKSRYAIEISEGKFLKSYDGDELIMSGKDAARSFRTAMEAEIFSGVYGGLENMAQYSVHKEKGFPKIVVL